MTSAEIPDYAAWQDDERYTIMAHAPTTMIFNDHDAEDKAKFIPAENDCESDLGVCGLMTVSNSSSVVLDCSATQHVVLCYYFARAHMWKKYTNVELTVNGPTSLSTHLDVEGDDMVASVVLSGVNVAGQCSAMDISEDATLMSALTVTTNDPAVSGAVIKAAIGNVQYGVSSEIGQPFEMTFATPSEIAVSSVRVFAPVSDIAPHAMEMYRKENGAWVLAFSWVTATTRTVRRWSRVRELSMVRRRSGSWWWWTRTWSVSATPNPELATFTYFTGLKLFLSAG